MQTENEAYAWLLNGHLLGLIEQLRQIPPDKWEWQPAPPAPSARLLAEHAWSWLRADRQHLQEPDVTRHSHIPPPPTEQQAMCAALEEEAEEWKRLLPALTSQQLLEPRKQFGMYPRTVREFVCHILQNTIYKHGQLSTIYYALGLDGTDTYTAPMPNTYYTELNAILALPLHAAAFKGETTALQALLQSGMDINFRDDQGVTPLMAAACQGQLEAMRLLIARGADLQAEDNDGHTALWFAESFKQPQAAELLRQQENSLQ